MLKNRIEYKWEERIGPIVYFYFNERRYGICFCHKKQDRGIKFLGIGNYLCSRCLGILIGGIVALVLHYIGFHLSFKISIILTMPLILDGFSQFLGVRNSNNSMRLLTGILFGISLNYLGVIL